MSTDIDACFYATIEDHDPSQVVEEECCAYVAEEDKT